MPNVDFPAEPAPPRTKSNCLAASGITCLVLLIISVLGFIWIARMVTKNPAANQFYNEAKLIAQCQLNLQDPGGAQDVYDALERYSTRYGKYPAKLADLYPTFLEDKSVLHCPADPRPKDVVSYDYTPPAPDAPGPTVMVECKRHVLMEGQPPLILKLRKDGQIDKQNFVPTTKTVKPR